MFASILLDILDKDIKSENFPPMSNIQFAEIADWLLAEIMIDISKSAKSDPNFSHELMI